MAKQLIWSSRALKERREILQFWKEHNQSMIYPRKLAKLFSEGAMMIFAHPQIGSTTNLSEIRFKLIREYKMYYRIRGDSVEILSIRDARRLPGEYGL